MQFVAHLFSAGVVILNLAIALITNMRKYIFLLKCCAFVQFSCTDLFVVLCGVRLLLLALNSLNICQIHSINTVAETEAEAEKTVFARFVYRFNGANI